MALTAAKPASHLEWLLEEAESERDGQEAKGEKQSTSAVIPRNSSSSMVANQSQKHPNGAQLDNLYPSPGQPSVAAHQIQLRALFPTLFITDKVSI